jgi:uncharacterized glyoxalase superfamily protein PhnB
LGHIDDLDAHFAHAKAAGATIVPEIEQYGYRAYTAADLEGRRWPSPTPARRWPDSS